MQTIFSKSGVTFDAKDAKKLTLSVHNAERGETSIHYRTPSGVYVEVYEETPGGFTDATPVSAYAARLRFRGKDTTRYVSEQDAFPETLCDAAEDSIWGIEDDFRNLMLSLVKCGKFTPEQAETIWLAVMSGTMGKKAESQPAPKSDQDTA